MKNEVHSIRNLTFYSYKFSFWHFFNVKRFIPNIIKNLKSYKELLNLSSKEEKINLLIWGKSEDFEPDTLSDNIKIYRVEDGFIRSVGLGIRFTPPISLVIDPAGIYFDAARPSYLEQILLEDSFDSELIERAEHVIEKIKKQRITKYNLNEKPWRPTKTSKKIVVIPGQVETDASIRYGSPFIKSNLELIKIVRKLNPDAYIVHKPHPDVVRGYRKGYIKFDELKKYCNEVVLACSSVSLIEASDEIHTLTSLFGFEALLYSRKVATYGQPFYSGYGLTHDICPNERRNKKRTLQELVVASLIIYPLYSSLINGKIIDIEEAIDEISFLIRKRPFKLKILNLIQAIADPFLKMRRF